MDLAALETRITRFEDIEAIKNLESRYCDVCDDMHNPDRIGTRFAQDGFWESADFCKAVGPKAMREIFVQRRICVAGRLARQFVRELDVYPHGAFVIMENGDLGLVIKRGLHAANAAVMGCFANAERQPYASPVIHDPGEADGRIIASIAAPRALALPLQKIWGLAR